ncbi:MAG: ATP-binding protein [Smithellaceae bacterium]
MLIDEETIGRRSRTTLTGQLLRSFLILLMILFLGAGVARAESQIVRVGVYENAPKIFVDASGKPSGIFIDIIEYIAKSEGWDLKYVVGTWAEGLDRLAQGEIDLMPDVAFTADREKKFSFHKIQVLSSWFQAYARKDSGIQSILDLNGKRIAILEQSVQQDAFAHFSEGFGLNITLVPVSDYKTMFEMATRGEVDAAVTNQFYGAMHAAKYGLVNTAVVFEPSALFFAASRNDPNHLLEAIDRHLSVLKKDTQSPYYNSLRKWTSEKVRFKVPLWLQILALIAGVALLMSLAGSFVLKRQVNARTRELRQINQEMEQRIIERTEKLEQANQKLLMEIEERAKTQKALFISETMYRDLVESANSVILRWTAEGKITFINKFALQFFGFSLEEIIGQNIIGTIVPEVETSGRDLTFLVYNVAKNPNAYEGNINENIKKNGQRVWVAWTNKHLMDESGQLVEILSIGVDITKLVEAEKELRETMAQLDKAKERAESADRLKSAFLATMSHELRTPLNSIIGFTGILLQRLGGPLNEEQEKQLGMVYNSAKHLLDLINDVLDISKIEAEQLNVVREPFNLRESIEKVMKSSQPLADKKGIELSASIAPDIGLIKSDRRRVEQVLLNLISNAIKFTEQGYVRLHGEVRGNDIVIDVRDSGIGIKQEDMGILFNAFQQIESGITRKYDGTGLGLTICKKLAHLLGGEIRVESEWGKGSTFSFILPKERETV